MYVSDVLPAAVEHKYFISAFFHYKSCLVRSNRLGKALMVAVGSGYKYFNFYTRPGQINHHLPKE